MVHLGAAWHFLAVFVSPSALLIFFPSHLPSFPLKQDLFAASKIITGGKEGRRDGGVHVAPMHAHGRLSPQIQSYRHSSRVCSPNSWEANARKPLSSKASLSYTVSPGLDSKRL